MGQQELPFGNLHNEELTEAESSRLCSRNSAEDSRISGTGYLLFRLSDLVIGEALKFRYLTGVLEEAAVEKCAFWNYQCEPLRLVYLAVLKHLELVDFDLRSADGLVELTNMGGRVYEALCNEGVYSESPDSNEYIPGEHEALFYPGDCRGGEPCRDYKFDSKTDGVTFIPDDYQSD